MLKTEPRTNWRKDRGRTAGPNSRIDFRDESLDSSSEEDSSSRGRGGKEGKSRSRRFDSSESRDGRRGHDRSKDRGGRGKEKKKNKKRRRSRDSSSSRQETKRERARKERRMDRQDRLRSYHAIMGDAQTVMLSSKFTSAVPSSPGQPRAADPPLPHSLSVPPPPNVTYRQHHAAAGRAPPPLPPPDTSPPPMLPPAQPMPGKGNWVHQGVIDGGYPSSAPYPSSAHSYRRPPMSAPPLSASELVMCPLCGQQCPGGSIWGHIAGAHPTSMVHTPVLKTPCLVRDMQATIAREHGSDIVKCPYCPGYFPAPSLLQHLWTIHPAPAAACLL
eukprot:Hpha_TRINITY_DN14840_c1_g3::TRINITY_DN14840_c1_g3_i1::g.169800::m.169800